MCGLVSVAKYEQSYSFIEMTFIFPFVNGPKYEFIKLLNIFVFLLFCYIDTVQIIFL